jgi:hypothetical protein
MTDAALVDGSTVDRPLTSRSGSPGAGEPVPVVYLAGLGRSGSTLLERLLCGSPGWWSLGEVVHLWRRGVRNDELCGCGERFSRCHVWRRIGDVAFGGWGELDVEEVIRWQRTVERDRYLPLLVRPGVSGAFEDRLQRYQAVLVRLYRAAQQVTGATVIVDASKHVASVLSLRHNPAVRLHPIHLVRDSRGVAYSWSRPVARPAAGGGVMMARWSPLETACRYVGYNVLLAATLGSRRHVLRYEDLVAAPQREVERIIRWVGVGRAPDDAVDHGHAELTVSHGISGNPMRAETGRVELRLDEAWRSGLSRRSRVLVTAVTWPSLVRSHYPVFGGRQPAPAPLAERLNDAE